jgi:hypothetical protein
VFFSKWLLFSVFALALFSSGFAFVFSHEMTHVALNGFRVDGYCFFDCRPMDNAGLAGNGYTPVGVYLSEPKNAFAEREELPTIVGIVGGLVVFGAVGGKFDGKN